PLLSGPIPLTTSSSLYGATVPPDLPSFPTRRSSDLAEILKQAEDLAAWAKEIKEHALTLAFRDGVKIPGFKVVEGRSTRKITDDAELAKRLEAEGYDPYKKVMKTLTELEKTVGKKRFAELADGLVEKPPGRPTLAPESDKRPEINSAVLDFKEEI